MILVSEPEARVLVRSPQENNHETTLVVPELSTGSIEYYKCLVNTGSDYDEHAIVVERESPIPLMDRAMIIRALNGSRPTAVSFLRATDGKFDTETGLDEAPRAALAVCAVVERQSALESSAQLFGISVTRQGKFYVCALGE